MSDEIKNIEETTEAAAPAAPVTPAAPAAPYERKSYGAGTSDDAEKPVFQRNVRFKRKVCRFCHDKNAVIDYKDVKLMEQFITDRGKILPRRVTGTCAKHQRGVAQAVKRARIIAIIPFVEK